MPNTRPTGTQPVEFSLVKSWPDRSQVNGRRSRLTPGGRTAVPTALHSSPPAGNAPRSPERPRAFAPAGVAHVVDRGAEHLPHWLEAGAADRGELVRGKRTAPHP